MIHRTVVYGETSGSKVYVTECNLHRIRWMTCKQMKAGSGDGGDA